MGYDFSCDLSDQFGNLLDDFYLAIQLHNSIGHLLDFLAGITLASNPVLLADGIAITILFAIGQISEQNIDAVILTVKPPANRIKLKENQT